MKYLKVKIDNGIHFIEIEVDEDLIDCFVKSGKFTKEEYIVSDSIPYCKNAFGLFREKTQEQFNKLLNEKRDFKYMKDTYNLEFKIVAEVNYL